MEGEKDKRLFSFMNKRKKDKRQSLIIDNFSYNESYNEQLKDEPASRKDETIIRRNSLTGINSEWNQNTDFIPTEYPHPDTFTDSFVESEEETGLPRAMIMNSLVHKNVGIFEEQKYKNKQGTQKMCKKQNEFNCTMCKNERSFKNDQYIILSCNHMFHVECLVDIHFDNFDKLGRVIDKKFCENCRCLVCDNQMEIEDIVHIHNKFTKTTKEYIKIQDNNIDDLDKKLSKLKDEMRNLLEYKQKLEQKREKSKQITITLNNLID